MSGTIPAATSESELSDLKKSADEKGLIAMIIRSDTTVRSAWLAEKLQMGTVANVTRVSNAMAAHLQDDKRLKRVKKKIYAIISSPIFSSPPVRGSVSMDVGQKTE